MDSGNWHQVLVFTRTKHGANRLTQALVAGGVRAAAIHGNKSQAARMRALSDFKQNRITALVATEVAARGLDIRELPHVANFELPNAPEAYVPRIPVYGAQPRRHGRHPSPRSHRAHSGKERL